jgi:hypothetical protein
MQTCTKCNASTPDSLPTCSHCNADLQIYSSTAVALKKYQANERIRLVRVTVAHDACPHCSGLLRTYPKSEVPVLPHPGCSHENGCRCFYEPVLKETAIVGKLVK